MARLDVEGVRYTYPNAERPAVDVSLSVADGELISLLGPSGCGKTTALRILAGFVTPQFGTVAIDGVDVTAVQPQRRPTAMVFQQYALWPHMNVWHNIAFGLIQRRVPRPDIERRVAATMEMLGLGDFRQRMPSQLSGGQQQRVALARALVIEPKILLLDEPLSNLDAHMRERVRDQLRQIQRSIGITTVFVTHDQSEALGISDRVAVMDGGVVVQFDRPTAIYATPGNLFVAGFIGTMNLLSGDLEGDAVLIGGCRIPVEAESPHVRDVTVAMRPEDIVIASAGERGAAAEVVDASLRGADTDVRVRGAFGTVRALLPRDVAPPVGTPVSVRIRRVAAYDGATGHLIAFHAEVAAAR